MSMPDDAQMAAVTAQVASASGAAGTEGGTTTPPVLDERLLLDACQMADLLRTRQTSAVELLQVHLAHIAQHNDRINAIVTLDADGALATAAAADADLAAGITHGPLHGVPFALKDCHTTAGMRTTAGWPGLADYRPEVDGTVAARLKAAGGVLLGKTNVAPLLADVQSDNAVFGRTNNPWNLARTPGGSSGGSAAAVAAHLVPLDIGSDIGGSIRIPAHCCGIYGLKPTERRVSNHGHLPDLPGHPRMTRIMNVCGPLARSIDDLALALALIQGRDGQDTELGPLPTDGLPKLPSVEPSELRLAWSASFAGLPVAEDIRLAIERTALALEPHVGLLDETLPDLDWETQRAVRGELRLYVRMLLEPPDRQLTAEDYLRTLDARDGFIRIWDAFFQTYDALLCPVQITTAIAHTPRDTPIPVDGVEQPYHLLADICRPFNLTGHPVVVVPLGLDRDGLPIGMQIVGARWDDARLLAIADAIRQIAPLAPLPLPPLLTTSA